jgi:hypothetical protein
MKDFAFADMSPVTAASGLALSTAPDVAHFLPFFEHFLRSERVEIGIATVLAPALAAILFITLAVVIVNCKSE